eukprot:20440_1
MSSIITYKSIEFCDDQDSKWYPAVILSRKSTDHINIIYKKHNKIMAVGPISFTDNPKVKPIYTHTIRIHKRCNISCEAINIQPIYYYDEIKKTDFILFAANYPRKEFQIYDIKADEFIQVNSLIVKGWRPFNHGHHIINKNGLKYYYVFGGKFGVFGIFDLHKLTLDIKHCYKTHKIERPLSVVINNNLHIFSNKGLHLRYNLENGAMDRLKSFGINHSSKSDIKLVHIENLKKVMVFGD